MNHYDQNQSQNNNQFYDYSSSRNNSMPDLLDDNTEESLYDSTVSQETRPTIASSDNFPFVLIPPQQATNASNRTRMTSQQEQQQPWCLQPRYQDRQHAHIFENLYNNNNNNDDGDDESAPEIYDDDVVFDHSNAHREHEEEQTNSTPPAPSIPILSPEFHNMSSFSSRTTNQNLLNNDANNERSLYVPSLKPRFNDMFEHQEEQEQRGRYSSFHAFTHASTNSIDLATTENQPKRSDTKRFDYCSSALSVLSAWDVYSTPH